MGNAGFGSPFSTKGENLMRKSKIHCGNLRGIVRKAFRGVYGRKLEPKHENIFIEGKPPSIVRIISSHLSEEKRKVVVRDFFTHDDVLGENGHEPANFILSFQGELSNEMFSILVSTFTLVRDTCGNEVEGLEDVPKAEARAKERFLEIFKKAKKISKEESDFAALTFLRENAMKMKDELDFFEPENPDW